jgi:hypothetical protein
VASVTNYLFDDVTGDTSYWYCTAYYNSSTTAESPKTDPMQASASAYVTVDDMRDEGFTSTEVTDDQIRRGASRAMSVIEEITGQWFEPRLRTFKFDGTGETSFFFDVPIIAITAIENDEGDVTMDFDTIKIYNRHLTQGLLNPDDRFDPKVVFDEYEWANTWGIIEKSNYWDGKFYSGRQNIKITGYFGYTELARGAPVGETSDESQVPLSYGETPELIKYAAKRLCARYMYPLSKQLKGKGTDLALQGKIKKRRNRDQSIEYGVSDIVNSSLTGDPEVDEILSKFHGPMRIGVV